MHTIIFDEELSVNSGDIMVIDYNLLDDRYDVTINGVSIKVKGTDETSE
ncbi:MAG: hypothetical protein R3321_06850 [Nitrososphaeraceae archaeon]|nr:hypothetical protein [Nitrososphaeraceae archaeon]